MIKTICLRFNLDKPLHKQAYEDLKSLSETDFKSYTSAVVTAVTDYFKRYQKIKADPYFETREREKQFVTDIVGAVERSVEKSMPSFLAACLTGFAQPCLPKTATEQTADENSVEIEDVDLDFIGG